MNIELILRDIRDLIYDAKSVSSSIYSDRRDADRVFNRVTEGEEYTKYGYETVAEGLVEASQALDRACEKVMGIEQMLMDLYHTIEMQTLSAKVQSK